MDEAANKTALRGILIGGRESARDIDVGKLGRTKPFAAPVTSAPDERDDVVVRFLSSPSEPTFYALFREFAPRMIAYFRVRGCETGLAEDLAQEVMLSVYRQAGSLRDRDSFRPWLYRIARNALLRHHRDSGRRVATVAFGVDTAAACEPAPDLLLHSQFAEWMAWLSPDERQIMVLRYVDELEHHEIAEVLGIPQGTVQWKIFHTKRKLAAHFGVKTT